MRRRRTVRRTRTARSAGSSGISPTVEGTTSITRCRYMYRRAGRAIRHKGNGGRSGRTPRDPAHRGDQKQCGRCTPEAPPRGRRLHLTPPIRPVADAKTRSPALVRMLLDPQDRKKASAGPAILAETGRQDGREAPGTHSGGSGGYSAAATDRAGRMPAVRRPSAVECLCLAVRCW